MSSSPGSSGSIREQLPIVHTIARGNTASESVMESWEQKVDELLKYKEETYSLRSQLQIVRETSSLQAAEFAFQKDELEKEVTSLRAMNQQLSAQLEQQARQASKEYSYEVKVRLETEKAKTIQQMEKTATVMEHLNAFRKGGARALSASALNTYLDCPLQFYFAVVEGIEEEDEVSETVESNVFGSILHKVMENVYRPFCGQQITAELLKAVREDVLTMTGAVARAFAEVFFKTDVVRPLTGQNFLIGEMIRKYATKILERDGALAPFRYLESEKKVRGLFSLSDGSEVQLKGFIDRVDEVGGTLRIIDYKSGTGTTVFPSVEALFDKSAADRPKAVMQVFMYAWMYANELSGRTAIQPGIYYVRTLFAPTFDAGIYHRVERGKQERVMDFADYRDAFEEGLRGCLDEIFSEETPFIQTTNGKACSYCRFRSICGK